MSKVVTKRDLELASKVKILAMAKGFSRAEFGRKLGVSRAQLLRWEKGLEGPSNQKLIALGNLADEALLPIDGTIPRERMEAIRALAKYPDSHWFWERAGVNLDAIRRSVWKTLTERDPSAGGKVVRVPRLEIDALLEFVKRGAVNLNALAVDLIPFPTLFVSDPASTICIQATDRIAGSPLFAGDLCLVRLAAANGSKAKVDELPNRSFENLIGCSVAAFYESLPVGRELSLEAFRHRPPARLFTDHDRREIEINQALYQKNNPAAAAEDERRNDRAWDKAVADAIAPGVLFGTLRVQSLENWDGDFNALKGDYPWRLVLDCGSTWNGLTPWNTESFPWDGTLRHRLNSGVHVLGAVIGWLRAPGGVAEP